jgi:acyl-coenzyme A thioesterase PaaI-like protein
MPCWGSKRIMDDKKPPLLYRSAKLFRFGLTWFGPYWGTGIRVTEVSEDYSRVVVEMRKRWFNSNAFGTHFGGSLYSMCDPFYCLTLVAKLGPRYVVWDQAANIEFVKPGKGTVKAVFEWTNAQIEDILEQAKSGQKVLPVRHLEIVDESGDVVARIQKTLYVRLKREKVKD